MGYSTDFFGSFKLNKTLDLETFTFLKKLNETRRMARKVGKEYGIEGEFYVEDDEKNVIDINRSPKTQPGLWCQWTPNRDGTEIEWDGGEKFYEYVAWLEYIIEKVLEPKGYKLTGEVEWQGEDRGDSGKIVVKNNKVKTLAGKTVYKTTYK